jgi:hypothetical protein
METHENQGGAQGNYPHGASPFFPRNWIKRSPAFSVLLQTVTVSTRLTAHHMAVFPDISHLF